MGENNKNRRMPGQVSRYELGTIRDLRAQIENLKREINALRGQLGTLINNQGGNSGFGGNSPLVDSRSIADSVGGGGVNSSQVISIVQQAILDGNITAVPNHDHTSNTKGGDAYAGLGAKLQ